MAKSEKFFYGEVLKCGKWKQNINPFLKPYLRHKVLTRNLLTFCSCQWFWLEKVRVSTSCEHHRVRNLTSTGNCSSSQTKNTFLKQLSNRSIEYFCETCNENNLFKYENTIISCISGIEGKA